MLAYFMSQKQKNPMEMKTTLRIIYTNTNIIDNTNIRVPWHCWFGIKKIIQPVKN